MFSPTVIELPRPLEPVSRDTFVTVTLPIAPHERPDTSTLRRPRLRGVASAAA